MKQTTTNLLASWTNQKEALRGRFNKLRDADPDFDENRKNEILRSLALKLGMTTREIIKVISRNG